MNAVPVEAPSARGRLLLVDDEEPVLRALTRVLRRDGRWDIATATTGEEGLRCMESAPAQVVVSDFRMPGMSGVEFLRRVKERWPDCQRVMLTGFADPQAIEEAVNAGEIFRFVAKPWDESHLAMTVVSAFEQHAALSENARLADLARDQNDQLKELARSLEEKVVERTRQLMTAKRDWEATFDAIDTPVALVRPDYKVKRANRAWARAAASELRAVSGSTCHALLFGRESPCAGCPLPAAFAGQLKPGAAVELEGRGGRSYRLQAYVPREGPADAAVCVYRDVTDEKRMQRALVASEKMAAIGRVAGAIAHEINNPLGAILAFAQLMRRDVGRTEGDAEALALVEESAQKCRRVVAGLLSYARRAPARRMALDLREPVEQAIFLFRAQIKESPRARLAHEPCGDLPAVMADPAQIQQVSMNLLHFALRALPGGEGAIGVRLSADDRGVHLAVTDTGAGIDAERLSHLFEPAFGSDPGDTLSGTDLGMATSYAIVEDHGGSIDVRTAAGQGTTLTVTLPRAGETSWPDAGATGGTP